MVTRGCTSTRTRSEGTLHGVVSPMWPASGGITSWYAYQPDLASRAGSVRYVPEPLARNVPRAAGSPLHTIWLTARNRP